MLQRSNLSMTLGIVQLSSGIASKSRCIRFSRFPSIQAFSTSAVSSMRAKTEKKKTDKLHEIPDEIGFLRKWHRSFFSNILEDEVPPTRRGQPDFPPIWKNPFKYITMVRFKLGLM